MLHIKSLRAFLIVCVITVSVASAQTARPATAPTTGPARGAGRGRGNGAPPPPATLLPLEPWDRPANGPAIFSEDFESGAINDKVWTVHTSGTATLSIQKDKVAHG